MLSQRKLNSLARRCFYTGGLGALLMFSGCEPKLETGYKPRPLNSSEPMRRSYYAAPFTPEANPDKKRDDDNGPGFGLQH